MGIGSALKQRLKFDPFGRRVFKHALAASASPVPSDGVREGFTGHQHDDELGLIDMRGRVYDANIGRFLTPDPFVQSPFQSQSHNRYSYVWNNPLRYTDPSGYQADQIICGNVPEDGCEEYMGVNGPAPDPWVDPIEMPDLPGVYDSWYATGPDGRKRERGGTGGRNYADRVTAGELMEMSPEERRAFMEEAAPGVPMPANFEALEVHDQLSDFAAEQFAEYLRTLQYAAGMNAAALPPMGKGAQIAVRGVANWKSVTQFRHTFLRHGAGLKNTRRLIGRAKGRGEPQGQWLDNPKAAEFLSGLKVDGPATVRIPEGLGQVIKPDGSIVPTNWAIVVPSLDGFTTAYPVIP